MSVAFDRVVAALGDRVTRQRDGHVKARCPGHDDREASLSVSIGNKGAVLTCFAGCPPEDIVKAMGLTMADLFDVKQGGGGSASSGKRVKDSKTSNGSGVTLAQYAAAKRLPVNFLEGLGLSNVSYQSNPAIRIPYFTPDGVESAVQFRVSLEGERFRWKTGSKPLPYGLNRLTSSPVASLALVEGPSDCQTLWYHGLIALGLPNATTWRSEWDHYLDRFASIYVNIEADRGGQAVEDWLRRTSFRDRVRLVRLEGVKDPSALHITDPNQFGERWAAALAAARPWTDEEAGRRTASANADFQRAEALLKDPRMLERVGDAIRAGGYAGDVRPATLAYMAVTSRHLDRPLNAAFVAPSGAGKNRAVDAGLALHPPEAYHVIRAGSARALIYCDETFEHRVVVFSEADSIPDDGPAASAARSLASDNAMTYDVTEKNPTTGRFENRHIVKPGPTGLLTTSTKSLPIQMGTRVLEVSLADDAAQTRHVMKAHASAVRPFQRDAKAVAIETFHAAQRWVANAGEHRVTVPFADRLAELAPADAVRMRRDFRQLLTMIQAVALLHQLQRPRTAEGWIEATADDYRLARDLLESVFNAIAQDAITPAVRETVLAVNETEELSEPQLAERLKISRSTVSYRVRRALAGGWLVNREIRKGHTARLARGVNLPEKTEALPTIAQVFESSNAFRDETHPPPPPASEQNVSADAEHAGPADESGDGQKAADLFDWRAAGLRECDLPDDHPDSDMAWRDPEEREGGEL